MLKIIETEVIANIKNIIGTSNLDKVILDNSKAEDLEVRNYELEEIQGLLNGFVETSKINIPINNGKVVKPEILKMGLKKFTTKNICYLILDEEGKVKQEPENFRAYYEIRALIKKAFENKEDREEALRYVPSLAGIVILTDSKEEFDIVMNQK